MAAWGYKFDLRVLKVSLTRERYLQHSMIKFVQCGTFAPKWLLLSMHLLMSSVSPWRSTTVFAFVTFCFNQLEV